MPERVLSARPDSWVTCDATISGKDGTNSEFAKIHFRCTREEGTILLSNPPKAYKVTHATSSGVWQLVLDDPHAENDPLIVATKPKWYRNKITLEMDCEVYELVRPSMDTRVDERDYIVSRAAKDDTADPPTNNNNGKKKKVYELSGTKIGELRADGCFKRTHTLKFDDDVPIELPLFCYWLVTLLTRRSN